VSRSFIISATYNISSVLLSSYQTSGLSGDMDRYAAWIVGGDLSPKQATSVDIVIGTEVPPTRSTRLPGEFLQAKKIPRKRGIFFIAPP
jgi:hypothetical protein